MKKFLFAAILIVGVIVGQIIATSQAEAADYYLGVYEDGREAYLMTETIKWYEEQRNGYLEAQGYTCTVKAVSRSGNVEKISYKYMYGPQVDGLGKNGTWYGFRDEYLRRVKATPNHPEARLMKYLIDRYNEGYRG